MNFDEPRYSFGTGKDRSASVDLGDIDGDGDLDAVIANGRHWPEENLVFKYERRGFNTMKILGAEHATSYAAELADMDNDGDLDIVEVNDNAPHKLYLNDGNGNFEFYSTFSDYSNGRNVAIGDLDNDGYLDIIVCNRGARNPLCFNNGDLTFTCKELITENNSTIDIAIADIDADGLVDIILANRDNNMNTAYKKIGRVWVRK